MGLLARWRRHRLPTEAARPWESGERVVAWAPVESGYLVATNRGLWLPGRDERLGWHEIHKVTWSERRLMILPGRLVREAASAPDAPVDVLADADQVEFTLTDPGDLPRQIRERVTRNIVYSTHHELSNGGVRVVARRVPGRDGLTYQLRYDPGTALIGPEHDLVADFVAQARQATSTA